LVAAFDHVRRNGTKAQVDRFKQHGLFGIEQESAVVVLAIVNMIFRGDGKHNITEGNCFTTNLGPRVAGGHATAAFTKSPCAAGDEPVTRVLMNPPFALNTSPEKEYRFVSRALELMADGGILFSLAPMGVLFGDREAKLWRVNDLLARHTLLSVISFPAELFVPAALKQVAGIIVKKGSPHPAEQDVFWGRIARDGHLVVKKKRLLATDMVPPRTEEDEMDRVLPALQQFLTRPGRHSVSEPLLYKTAPIDYGDPLLELVPEAYIDSREPTPKEIRTAVNNAVRARASFLVRFGHAFGAEA
jgi:type I restriction enzyme M protein